MSRVREIMTPGVDVIAPTATTADAARNMKNLDVGAIPVCEGENLLGMVTDRDLVLRVMADGRNPLEAKVGEVMTPGLYFCYDDEEVETAAALMSDSSPSSLITDPTLGGDRFIGRSRGRCVDHPDIRSRFA